MANIPANELKYKNSRLLPKLAGFMSKLSVWHRNNINVEIQKATNALGIVNDNDNSPFSFKYVATAMYGRANNEFNKF